MFARLPVMRLSIAITLVPLGEQAIGEMRAEKPGAAGDDGDRFRSGCHVRAYLAAG